jgi:hypothetical protein
VASGGQTDAKRTTRQEFIDIMQKLIPLARAAMAAYGLQARFSYDNNKIQQTAGMRSMGMLPEERVPLGEYMPDCHKVIEHTFGQLKPEVNRELYKRGHNNLTAQAAQQLVKDCFFGMTQEDKKRKQERIAADVKSLPLTYFVVSRIENVLELGPDGSYHRGTGGDWPMANLR